ncbi:DNA primase/helicase [Vibrio phage 277E43-1]|nr:DNA primase/helicase [Vibrio phage 277E43-1]
MSVSAKKGRQLRQYYRHEEPLTVEEVKTFPCVAVPQQDIIKEDAEYFGVRSEYSQEDGTTLVASYFPYYNQDGKLTGYKRRDWTKDKEEHGHFTVVGVVKVSSQMFGQHKCKVDKKSTIIIAEGEGDTVAARRDLLNSLKGTKWEGKIEPNVIGLNCGVGNAQQSVAHNEKFIRSFKDICCVLDNDSATEVERAKGIKKGKEGTEDVAAYLLSQEFYVVNFPEEIKDIRQWVATHPREFAKAVSFNKIKYSPEKVISLQEVSVEDLRKKKKVGLPLKYFPKLTDTLFGLTSAELITVLGPSGSGKSTVTRYMEKDIIDYLRHGLPEGYFDPESANMVNGKARLDDYIEGEKLGVIRLEEDKEEAINSWYGMELGYNPKNFANDPEAFIDQEQHAAIHKQWQEEDIVRVLDHFGSIPIDELLNKFKQLMAFGCRWFVLDHISMVISGLRTGDERKELDIVMTHLAAFCKQHNVTILMVSHMSRIQFKPPLDKETGEQLPFFYPVRKENLRGSASLEQLSWSVIAVEPEELPNRSRGRVRLVSLKNRRGKKLGNADTLWMEEETGKFVDASKWEIEGENYVCQGEVMHCFGESLPEINVEPVKTLGVDEQSYQQPDFVINTGLVVEGDEDIDEPF